MVDSSMALLQFYPASSSQEGRIQPQKGLRMISRFFLLFIVFAAGLQGGLGDTNPQDGNSLAPLSPLTVSFGRSFLST